MVNAYASASCLSPDDFSSSNSGSDCAGTIAEELSCTYKDKAMPSITPSSPSPVESALNDNLQPKFEKPTTLSASRSEPWLPSNKPATSAANRPTALPIFILPFKLLEALLEQSREVVDDVWDVIQSWWQDQDTRLVPTVLPKYEHIFDAHYDIDAKTGQPIYTLRARIPGGEEVGYVKLYGFRGFCRSEDGARHNMIEAKGVYELLAINTTKIEDVCVSLPKTFLDELQDAVKQSAIQGGLRGGKKTLKYGLQRQGYSANTAKIVGECTYYTANFTVHFAQCLMRSERVDEQAILDAAKSALWDTGIRMAANATLFGVKELSYWGSQKLKSWGYEDASTYCHWFGRRLFPLGVYAVDAYRSGTLQQAPASIATGVLVKNTVERVGKCAVDQFLKSHQAAISPSEATNEPSVPALPALGK